MRMRVAAIGVLLLLVSACSFGGSGSSADSSSPTAGTTGSAATTAANEATPAPENISGTMTLNPATAIAGSTVTVTGNGLPANTSLQLTWGTQDCKWLISGSANEQYDGRACTPRTVKLSTVSTGSDGSLQTTFTVPDDYGFEHTVTLVDSNGVIRNKSLFEEGMQVSIEPTSGPVGTPITITVKGMGVQTMEDTRAILYDNAYTGFLSAVTTRGTAVATIPATGQPGLHIVDIDRGAYTFPYLNPAQSPRPDIPAFHETFTVTSGTPVQPTSIADQDPKPVTRTQNTQASGTSISTNISAGPVGTDLTITGAGFPANQTVKIIWYRIVGNRVSGKGWSEQSLDFAQATSGSDGTFSVTKPIPADVGGAHRIEAQVGGKSLAETSVSILPHAEALSTAKGPAGTSFNIHLTGVGWTATANIYTVVYDNSYIGYACGFNSQGTVDIPMIATGVPGWHYIDLYPAIYSGTETKGRNNFRIPQLTYAKDHPGENLPAFHYAFYVEPGSAS